jgi:hypothetical protein
MIVVIMAMESFAKENMRQVTILPGRPVKLRQDGAGEVRQRRRM